MSLKNRNFNHHQRYTHHIYHNETVIVRTIFSNSIPIIPITFKNAYNRYTGLKKTNNHKLTN